jgi:TfoX/Sxy family transcriptional regulator of competence genes
VTEKKMFGGLAFMRRGNLCAGVVGEELMLRVGPVAYDDALAQQHAREMNFTGKPMKGLVYVATAGIDADADLTAWIGRGLAFAGAYPAK